MGIVEIYTLILIIMKLTGFIDWTWFQVFVPMMIYLGILLTAALVWVRMITKKVHK